MYGLGSKRSVIRETFEFGKKRAAEVGAENVYDFSLGNPSVSPPQIVEDTLLSLLRAMRACARRLPTISAGRTGSRAILTLSI